LMPYIFPAINMFSQAVPVENTVVCWNVTPTFFRTSFTFETTSKSEILTVPSFGKDKVANILVKVDFPAPFGPISPKIEPFFTLRDTLFKAAFLPNVLLTAFKTISKWSYILFPPSFITKGTINYPLRGESTIKYSFYKSRIGMNLTEL